LHTIEIGVHTQFIGEIMDVKGDPDVFGDDGQLDIMKIKPLIFDTSHSGYHGVGPRLGKAFSIGKGLSRERGR
jgi:flavin reductase (DIM6/NTAB) family NADH-FMN oxidoreductase RutF